jgi:hypothetical protein
MSEKNRFNPDWCKKHSAVIAGHRAWVYLCDDVDKLIMDIVKEREPLTVEQVREWCGHKGKHSECLHFGTVELICDEETCPIIAGLIKEGICQIKS